MQLAFKSLCMAVSGFHSPFKTYRNSMYRYLCFITESVQKPEDYTVEATLRGNYILYYGSGLRCVLFLVRIKLVQGKTKFSQVSHTCIKLLFNGPLIGYLWITLPSAQKATPEINTIQTSLLSPVMENRYFEEQTVLLYVLESTYIDTTIEQI